MKLFDNRSQAGQLLANALISYKNNPNVIVLALPRGGVPVAYEITKKLQLPLDVWLVRKLGVPGQEELAMGAISLGDAQFFNEEIIKGIKHYTEYNQENSGARATGISKTQHALSSKQTSSGAQK